MVAEQRGKLERRVVAKPGAQSRDRRKIEAEGALKAESFRFQ